jgi:hypothetical protein
MKEENTKMKNIWFSVVVVLTVIGVSIPAFAIPIYVVDDSRTFGGGYSSKIVIMDSEAPHDEITLNAGTGLRLTDAAITPSGSRLYTITGDGGTSLYRYDSTNGSLLDSWDLGIGDTGFKNALVAETETSLLLMSNNRTNIWRINLNAAGDYISTDDLGDVGLYSSGDLAFSPDGVLYLSSVDVPNSLTAKNRLYSIDLNGSPVVTEIGVIHEAGHNPDTDWLTQIFGLAFDEAGVLYGGRGAYGVAEDVYTISLLNASATFGWTMQCRPPTGINGFASVPEPATVCLLGVGALSLICRKKGV